MGTSGADRYFQCLITLRLDLLTRLGKSYIIRHCIEEMRKQTEDKLFRAYLTDGIKAIADNTAALYSKGVSLKFRYIEIIDDIKPDKQPEKPKETAEQIIERISSGINKLKKGG